MSIFQHPHLTRGIVKTPKGAFVISRGLVEMPADLGESLGWRLVDDEDDMPTSSQIAQARAAQSAGRSPAVRHSGESA